MAVILPYAAAQWEAIAAAAGTILGALILAAIVDRTLRMTERRLAQMRGAAGIDAGARTRLRIVRRLTFALVAAVGIFTALLQFDSFDRVANAALASGALLSAILGFAARESLSNVISGVMLAITQPLRVGDVVSIGEVSGVVEDVTLTFTWIQTADEGHVAVPNQAITTQALRNDSIRDHQVAPSVTVWIDPRADEGRALEALRGVPGAQSASVDDATPEGVCLRVGTRGVEAGDRAGAETRLRAGALAALREAGVPLAAPGG